MSNKCPDCGRKKAFSGEAWVVEFHSAHPETAATCGAHLPSVYSDESTPDCKEATLAHLREQLRAFRTPEPLRKWHEDIGPVLCWRFPLTEPPYVGSPLDTEWPGYHTHWTVIPEPEAP